MKMCNFRHIFDYNSNENNSIVNILYSEYLNMSRFDLKDVGSLNCEIIIDHTVKTFPKKINQVHERDCGNSMEFWINCRARFSLLNLFIFKLRTTWTKMHSNIINDVGPGHLCNLFPISLACMVGCWYNLAYITTLR